MCRHVLTCGDGVEGAVEAQGHLAVVVVGVAHAQPDGNPDGRDEGEDAGQDGVLLDAAACPDKSRAQSQALKSLRKQRPYSRQTAKQRDVSVSYAISKSQGNMERDSS